MRKLDAPALAFLGQKLANTSGQELAPGEGKPRSDGQPGGRRELWRPRARARTPDRGSSGSAPQPGSLACVRAGVRGQGRNHQPAARKSAATPGHHRPIAWARSCRAFGEGHALAEFTTRKIACSEEEAWRFTAVALHLSEGVGAYRGPAGTTLVFMTFGTVTLSKNS